MVHAQTRIHPRKCSTLNYMGFLDIVGCSSPGQRTRHYAHKREPVSSWILLFQLTTQMKIQESGKMDLTRELKNLRNMKVIVIPVVVSALGIVPKGLKQTQGKLEIRGRIETIQTTVLKSVRILERVRET